MTSIEGGPLYLESISIPAACGEELAQEEFQKKSGRGNFTELISTRFSSVVALCDQDFTPDISQARESFKEQTVDNRSYKFTPGRSSMNYELSIKDYVYKDKNNKRNEHALGEAIYSNIKQTLKLDVLLHSQRGRGAGKYRNLDFEGFRVQKTLNEDEFLMYSFELKPENSVTAVSQAVSQAVNYHSQSNFTYIIIPQFDSNTFPDSERLDDLLAMCKANQLGVLSIEMDVESHEVKDIVEVLPAPHTPLDDPDRLTKLVEESSLEKCPLCRKIVDTANNRVRCGWLVNTNDDQRCMKELLEEKVTTGK